MKLFFKFPVSINYGKYIWNINGDKVTHTFVSNNEETDPQMMLHATLSSEDLSLAGDIDVLILMIYAYSKYMVKRGWFLDMRMTNVLILEQFPCILVNDMLWHY